MNTTKAIKQSVINTFNRTGIDYERLSTDTGLYEVTNRFSGETVNTTALVAAVIATVIDAANQYEVSGKVVLKPSDFDRLRYFVLEVDSHAYMTCLD